MTANISFVQEKTRGHRPRLQACVESVSLHRYVRALRRNYTFLHVVNGIAPVAVFRHAPADDIEIQVTKASRNWAHLTCTNRTVINACYGADLRARSTEEHFVGEINLSTVDRPLLNFHPQFIANQLDHSSARDAFENVIGNG